MSVTNASGVVQTNASFIGNINPIRYRGYYYDTDLGLYYLQSRYYDPETGRFVNGDNIVPRLPDTMQDYNLYAYCADDPVNNDDPTGDIRKKVTIQNVSDYLIGLYTGEWSLIPYMDYGIQKAGIHKYADGYNRAGGLESLVAYYANKKIQKEEMIIQAEKRNRYQNSNGTSNKTSTNNKYKTKSPHTLYSVISGASPQDLLPSMSYGDKEKYAKQSMREYLDKNKYIRLYP